MASSVKELNAMLVGSNSSRKYLVGNIILGRQVFDPKNATSSCERGDGEVCGRRVTLVNAPGWLRGYDLCNTPELFKTEAILSARPGPHGFILVINAELPFKNVNRKATKQHLQHYFGEKVWEHTIVVFSHRGYQDQKAIEHYIERGGAPLKSLLEACGNRYHVLCNDDAHNDEKVKELFEKIDTMVAENSCYQTVSTLIQNAESKRTEVDKRAEELRLKSQQERQNLRKLMTEPTLNLRILMVGWVFSGKSATGDSILRAEVFQSGDKTVKALKQSGEVAGRDVTIVDTPGWWKFFPAMFTPDQVKSEILKGVSLCSPSPNVILLAVPLDTSFTNEQRRVIEENMRLLGQRVWRHVIVVFTIGNVLGGKTIEQHIESEGKPLRWLIEKCGNRYHVIDNTSAADDQVTELMKKMEEMVAGNSSFYLSAYPDVDESEPQEDDNDKGAENTDENTTKEITLQLSIEWDRKNWEKHHGPTRIKALSTIMSEEQKSDGSEGEEKEMEGSMEGEPPLMSGEQRSDGSVGEKKEMDGSIKVLPPLMSGDSEGEEQQMKHWHEDDQFRTSFDLGVESEDDAGSGPLKRWKRLLEREWSRREVAMEQHFWRYFYNPVIAASEPDSDQLQISREKVSSWLNTLQTTSGSGAASNTSCKENANTKRSSSGRGVLGQRRNRKVPRAGGSQRRKMKSSKTN